MEAKKYWNILVPQAHELAFHECTDATVLVLTRTISKIDMWINSICRSAFVVPVGN